MQKNQVDHNTSFHALDAYAPSQIAHLVEQAGVNKAALTPLKTAVLGVLAGVFIAFGAMLYTLAISDSQLGFGLTRVIGGIAFSLGLILVVIAGAELFTGNNLIVMAWANRDISSLQLIKNWMIVFISNFAGAVLAAIAMHYSGLLEQNNGLVGHTALAIAAGKVHTPVLQLFIRAILCNTLVCLAVWLCIAAHDVASKAIAIVFPITAFVALGFEHCVANMYFIPLAMMSSESSINMTDLLYNLIPVTVGNIIGGSVLVAFVYWLVYLRS